LSDFVVEAGANSGTETLLLSRLVGDQGKVIAFEPVERVVERLKKNLLLNDINNVSVNQLALGDTNTEISFFLYPEDHPNQGMGSKVLDSEGLEEIKVQQTTLDNLFVSGQLPRLDFLKMDVQGSELDILKGGRRVISQFKPKIFLEAADDLSGINEIFNFLTSLNYQVFLILKNGELEVVELDKLKNGNWLAISN